MLRVATLASVLAVAACANQGDEQMYVLNNTAVPGTDCVLTSSTTQPFLAHGEIWAGSSKGYFLTPLIESRIMQQSGIDPIQNTIQLRSANVELSLKSVSIKHVDGAFETSQPNSSVGTFSALFSGALQPGGTVNVGFEVLPPAKLQEIIDGTGGDPYYDTIRAEVLATVTIFGDINGSEVTSSPFLYPITICTDCVVSLYVDDMGIPLACPVPMGYTPRTGNACNKYQDGAVDCCRVARTDGTYDLVCPAPVATM